MIVQLPYTYVSMVPELPSKLPVFHVLPMAALLWYNLLHDCYRKHLRYCHHRNVHKIDELSDLRLHLFSNANGIRYNMQLAFDWLDLEFSLKLPLVLTIDSVLSADRMNLRVNFRVFGKAYRIRIHIGAYHSIFYMIQSNRFCISWTPVCKKKTTTREF